MVKFSSNKDNTTNPEKLVFAINFYLCKSVAMVDISAAVALALAHRHTTMVAILMEYKLPFGMHSIN